MHYAVFLSCISLVPSLDLSREHMHRVISYRICQKTGNSSHFLPYVTVFWKTDQELKSIFCLYLIGTLMHYPETPSTRQ